MDQVLSLLKCSRGLVRPTSTSPVRIRTRCRDSMTFSTVSTIRTPAAGLSPTRQGLGKVVIQAATAIALLLMGYAQRSRSPSETKTAQPVIQHFVFTDAGSGRTGGHNAQNISFHNYDSEDGVRVQRLVERYRSDQEAQVRLKKLTAGAKKVIERGTKKTAEGNLVGPRVVVL